jgi:hypothetical protein
LEITRSAYGKSVAIAENVEIRSTSPEPIRPRNIGDRSANSKGTEITMTEITETAVSIDPVAVMAAPLRAAFTATMTPYANGEAVAPDSLIAILTEALTTAEPTPELIALLCELINSAAPTTALLGVMHRAMGAALGLSTAVPAARAARPVYTRPIAAGVPRPGGLRERIVGLFGQDPTRHWTVSDLARDLGNGSGAVGAALDRMVESGEAILAANSPKRYTGPTRFATSEDAPDHTEPEPETAAELAPDASDTAPTHPASIEASGSDQAVAEDATGSTGPADPTPAARRKPGKSA